MLNVSKDVSKEEVEAVALADEKVKSYECSRLASVVVVPSERLCTPVVGACGCRSAPAATCLALVLRSRTVQSTRSGYSHDRLGVVLGVVRRLWSRWPECSGGCGRPGW